MKNICIRIIAFLTIIYLFLSHVSILLPPCTYSVLNGTLVFNIAPILKVIPILSPKLCVEYRRSQCPLNDLEYEQMKTHSYACQM